MSKTPAQRKSKQRQEMVEKGYKRKDLWLTPESIRILENFKAAGDFSSLDEALNQLLRIKKEVI